jgi:hypothetical protein
MTDNEIRNLFAPLWADVQGEGRYPNKRPLLAHYTKVPVLESILRNNEIWFSHPLLMNDPQEVIFGLDVGVKLLLANEKIKAACGSPGRFERLKNPLFIGSTSLQRGNFQTLLGCVFRACAGRQRWAALDVARVRRSGKRRGNRVRYGAGCSAGRLVPHHRESVLWNGEAADRVDGDAPWTVCRYHCLCLPVSAGNRGDRDQEHRTAECNLAGSSRLEESSSNAHHR